MKRANGTTFRGIVRERMVVFEENPGLPEGTPVVVTPLSAALGTPQAVLAAVQGGPHVSGSDVTALLRAIGKGRRPAGPVVRREREGR